MKHKIFLFVVIAFILFYLSGGKRVFLPGTKKEFQYLALFSEVAVSTRAYYLDNIKPAAKFPGAYSAMLGTLDRTAAYLDAKQTETYRLYTDHTAFGTGIYGAKSANYFIITDVLEKSPAKEAGLAPGDRIRAVGGQSLFGQASWQMILSLLSDKALNLELLVLKRGARQPTKVTLQTAPITPDIQVKRVGQDILLVTLPRIDKRSAAYLEETLKIAAAAAAPLKLILDLRTYSGGDFESLLEISKLFFPKEANLTLTKKKKHEQGDFAIGSKEALNYRAAVIVNQSTIMYGELLAALFKAAGTAGIKNRLAVTLVGKKTAGFISSLKQVRFEDGSSILVPQALFLLNARPAAPSGIKPHIELKMTDLDRAVDRCIQILDNDYGKEKTKET